jgi:hypothetical protein
MKANRKLVGNDNGQMQMIGAAVGLFITIIICILIYYNIAASTQQTAGTDTSRASQLRNASRNATTTINNQAATFFTIAPIIGVVIVAVVVISYVKQIG